jgi:hypothetical protein
MTVGVLATVSKDAWFAGFFLGAAAASTYAIRHTGRQRWVLFGIAAVGYWMAAAARPNGVVPVAGAIAFGWPLARGVGRSGWLSVRGLKRVGAALLLVAVLVMSQRVYTAVVVDPQHVHPETPGYQFDLAAISVRTGEMLLPSSSLRPGATLDDIRAVLDDGDGGYLWFIPNAPVNFAVGSEAAAELRDAWLRAIREHPIEMAQHRFRTAWAILNLDRPTFSVYDPPQLPSMWPDLDYTLHPPFFPSVTSWVEGSVAHWSWYGSMRAWIFSLALLVVGLSPRGRRSLATRHLVAGGIGSQLSFMVAGTSSGFRYTWFTMLCALLAVAIGTAWICGWTRARFRRRAGPSTEPDRQFAAGEATSRPDDTSGTIHVTPA